MPAPQWDYETFAAGNVATPNATEGVIATTRAVSSQYAGSQFGVKFSGLFTAGATTTSVTFRIRQGSLTGTVVRTDTNVLISAAQIVLVRFEVVDSIAGEAAGAVWVLTATQTAGTAPGGLTNAWTSVTTPV